MYLRIGASPSSHDTGALTLTPLALVLTRAQDGSRGDTVRPESHTVSDGGRLEFCTAQAPWAAAW